MPCRINKKLLSIYGILFLPRERKDDQERGGLDFYKKAGYARINSPCPLIHEGVFLSPLLLYNVAMNILQQIFSDHYEEIKKPLT